MNSNKSIFDSSDEEEDKDECEQDDDNDSICSGRESIDELSDDEYEKDGYSYNKKKSQSVILRLKIPQHHLMVTFPGTKLLVWSYHVPWLYRQRFRSISSAKYRIKTKFFHLGLNIHHSPLVNLINRTKYCAFTVEIGGFPHYFLFRCQSRGPGQVEDVLSIYHDTLYKRSSWSLNDLDHLVAKYDDLNGVNNHVVDDIDWNILLQHFFHNYNIMLPVWSTWSTWPTWPTKPIQIKQEIHFLNSSRKLRIFQDHINWQSRKVQIMKQLSEGGAIPSPSCQHMLPSSGSVKKVFNRQMDSSALIFTRKLTKPSQESRDQLHDNWLHLIKLIDSDRAVRMSQDNINWSHMKKLILNSTSICA